MSIGNLKTEGGKGTNWPWQYKMLLGLDKIAAAVATGGKDYESDLISIVCGANPAITRLEVRIYDPSGTPTWTIKLYPPGSTVEDTTDYSTCTKTYLESGDATEATLQDILTKVTANEVNTAGILADTAVIETNTTGILADTAVIETNTDTLRNTTNAPTILRATASALVTLNTQVIKSISFYNATTDAANVANVNGVILRQGETVNFDAGGNGNKFPTSSFNYDADPDSAGAGDLLIIYVE